ncbi:MAG: FlgD immunoglobulin-like domain containing protein [Candidatus Krumholzibacteriia bacterium]
MATSGGLGCPDSDTRITYYGNNGLPHLLFDGGDLIVGAGTDAVDGSVYDPVVQKLLDDATPVKMTMSDVVLDPLGSSCTVTLELTDDLASSDAIYLRVAIVEDQVTYASTTYENILRDLLPDVPLTISEAGQTQVVPLAFTFSGSWVAANSRLVAFVQRDADKRVLQTCNSRPTPDHSLRYYALGERTVIAGGEVVFDEAALFNTGNLDDTYQVTLDTAALPAGWSAHFTHDAGVDTDLTLPLAAGASAAFHVVIDAVGTGEGQVTLTFTPQSGGAAPRAITYKVITPGTEILIVDDDGAYDYETRYFAPALASTGRSFAIWDRNSTAVSAAVLDNFDAVIWSCGWAFPTVDADDRAALASYLDGGGNLFITGQDIGWEMADQGGAALAWYQTYLHATYVADDTNLLTLQGVPGDPITDGLSLAISGGDGADNQEYPSDIDPRGAGASVILTYDASRNGAIKADTGLYKVVYLAFGYEAINNPADRAALMAGIVDWLLPDPLDAPGNRVPAATAVLGSAPNPFNPMTVIRYAVATEADVTLGVFDVRGRLVRRLDQGRRAVGEHAARWDGLDQTGQALPSGTYVCRIVGSDSAPAVKLMLVR